MSDEKLLPCPFCGDEPELHWINEAGEVLTAWVRCKCGCEHHERLTKEVAVKKWNSRHLPNDAQISREPDEALSLIDKRLADLREANDIFRASSWDRSTSVERNDREIRWLIDLRTILRLPDVAAEAPEIDRLRAVFEAAYGLCCGYDWNCGTAAIAAGYRRKLLSAVNAIKEVPDFDGKYRDYGPSVASAMREGK